MRVDPSDVDPRRLIRASKVKLFSTDERGDPLPESHYMAVNSKGEPYYLFTEPHLSCDCPDHEIRGLVCKHLLRALVAELEPAVVEEVRDLGIAPVFGQGG